MAVNSDHCLYNDAIYDNIHQLFYGKYKDQI